MDKIELSEASKEAIEKAMVNAITRITRVMETSMVMAATRIISEADAEVDIQSAKLVYRRSPDAPMKMSPPD